MITSSYRVEGTEDEESKRKFLAFMEKNFGRAYTDIIEGSRVYPYDFFNVCIKEEKNGFYLKINESEIKGYYPVSKNRVNELEEKINSSGFNLERIETEKNCEYKTVIQKRYKNGDLDVKIFPDKDDCSFIRKRFSKKEYQDILIKIKKGEFSLE